MYTHRPTPREYSSRILSLRLQDRILECSPRNHKKESKRCFETSHHRNRNKSLSKEQNENISQRSTSRLHYNPFIDVRDTSIDSMNK